MRRSTHLLFGIGAAALAALLEGACGSDEAIVAPTVTVLLRDEAAGCFAICEGSDALDEAVAKDLGAPLCSGAKGAIDTRACTLRGGVDRLLVVADYAGIRVDACETVDLPKLFALLDEQGAKEIDGLLYGCLKGDDGGRHYYVHRTLTAPVARSAGVAYRVTSGANYTRDTPPFALSLPVVDLAVCQDETGTCHKVAAVDSTDVTVTVPAGVSASSATVRWAVGDGFSGQITVPLDRTEGTFKSGAARIDMPNAPNRTMAITAFVGDLDPVEREITLDAPADLVVRTEKKDVPKVDYTGLVAGDPDAVCRWLEVRVEAPSGAPGKQVTIQASQGTLDGASGAITRGVTPDAPARALLEIPFGASSQSVALSANAGGLLSGALGIDFLRALPGPAVLATPQKTAAVGPSGAPPVVIKGTAAAPKTGAVFAPDTPLLVVVTATAASPAPALPCGAPVDPADIGCSPLDPTELPGGCLLAPKTASVSPTGDFTISLAGGICFAGTISVDVWSAQYTSTENCLRDRKVSAAPQRLTVGPPLALTYGP